LSKPKNSKKIQPFSSFDICCLPEMIIAFILKQMRCYLIKAKNREICRIYIFPGRSVRFIEKDIALALLDKEGRE